MSAAPATSTNARKRGKASVRGLGIPAKLNAHSEGKLNGIPGRSRTPSERSDAGNSIVQEVFGFINTETCPERPERKKGGLQKRSRAARRARESSASLEAGRAPT